LLQEHVRVILHLAHGKRDAVVGGELVSTPALGISIHHQVREQEQTVGL
jgi:hypothetical protein